ncbi:MAG: hypothetical protein WEA09_14080 [Gemmatimonadota bacterium]
MPFNEMKTQPPEPELWIETRRGGLFFVNALFIFPQVMVLVPLATRIFVRGRGGLARDAPILDTFPMIAEHLLPRMGWLLVIPLALVAYNLTLEDALLPRLGLWAMFLLHLSFLVWAVGVWTGVWTPVLPGRP